MMRLLKYWGIFSSFIIVLAVATLILFVFIKAFSSFSLELIFGDTSILDGILGRKKVWQGLWVPLLGTLKLIFFSSLFAIPTGLCMGIYMAEYAGEKKEYFVKTILETIAGLPSILAGLFGFILILILNIFFSANTCLLLASFCLGTLILPFLAINTSNALKAIPQTVRISAACVGLNKEKAIFKILLPSISSSIFSGILMACGRCAEDTAVILMTGAVASSAVSGILNKFEALPFFIYYTSANYSNERQLSQVFAAAAILLLISLIFVTIGNIIRKIK